MKEQIVVRTSPKEPPIVLEKSLSEGYIVVICNPVGKKLEYILERETEDSHRKDIGTWIIRETKDRYYYKCSNCNSGYAVLRKDVDNSYDADKYVRKYCSDCGAKIGNVIREFDRL